VLPWLDDRRYAPLRGSDAFCEVLRRQAAEWSSLQQENPDAGICVAGDFNQDLAPSHYYGSARGRLALRHALAEARLVCLTAGADDPLAQVPAHASIDHLCVSEWLLPAERPQARSWPSPPLDRHRLTDHFGVYVDLELKA
jgi:endonuclease/exonuclease/phosphatase family metal-dependent hydrolase